jgi:hypothetical protein
VSGHTPGPWRHHGRRSESQSHRGFAIWSEKCCIGDVFPLDPDGNGGEANARLIAAAPEMYELLKEIDRRGYLGIHDDPEDAVDPARELIKRIEGRELDDAEKGLVS